MATMITAETLLSDILTFCEANKISPTKFGKLASKDGHLVRRIQAGKTLTLKRIEQVQKFMAEYRPADHGGGDNQDGNGVSAAQPSEPRAA